jgi:hypothetical protein
MRTISSAAIALAALACSDGPDPDPDPTPTGPVALVWPVARGDVMARVNAVAERLGLPPVRNDGTELTSDDGDRRLLADYLTGRIRLYAQTPIGLPITDDDDAIDAAAAYLDELGLLPAGNDACRCAAGLVPSDDPTCAGIAVAPGPRSAWKSCATLAVRVVGMTSDLLPPERMTAPLEMLEAAEGAAPTPTPEPVEIAFTPRLPIVRAVDGTIALGEISGGHADLVVRFAPGAGIVAVDARFQPPGPTPIELPLRSREDAAAELTEPDSPPPDLTTWSLGYYSRGLVTTSEHDNTPHPLAFYHPLYLQLIDGTNVAVRAAVASSFLPRLVAAELPEVYDAASAAPLTVWFDGDSGAGAPTVTWSVRDPELGLRTLATTVATLDPEHPGTWKAALTPPPPDGDHLLTLAIADARGTHYVLDDLPVSVSNSSTARGAATPWRSHNVGWRACGPLAFCHSDDVKVTAVCLDGNCRTGPVGVKVEIAGDRPQIGRTNNVFIKDLAVLQFHLDLKLRIPERKKDLARGWAEDWPLPGDPDAIVIGGQRYKEFWIRTDTCKLDGANTYSCSVVPNTARNPQPAPANPHRKMGMRCPAEFGHPNEQGAEDSARCTEPTVIGSGFAYRRVFTGMPGRLTLTTSYQMASESTGPAVSTYLVDLAKGTVLRLVRANTNRFDPTITARTATMLKRVGTLAPAVKPETRWHWEGDKPRTSPDAMKVYGGMEVECYNALEVCRQANGYDPRRFPWNHGGAVRRPVYVEAANPTMIRPWELGQQASAPMSMADRMEGNNHPYCPHELYKVLKERFCPCPDDGSPCAQTGGDASERPNPMLPVVEVRLGLYQRMTPFEAGHATTALVTEMKSLPEMMMALEGHRGAKAESAIPSFAYLNNIVGVANTYKGWLLFLFPALGPGLTAAWAGALAARATFDALTDWIDVFHWYEPMNSVALVRPQSNVTAVAPVNGFINAFYNAALGTVPQYAPSVPIGPPGTIGWGDKTRFPRVIPPVGAAAVPPAFDQQGFWQNLHFKSVPIADSSTTSWIVVPGCQSLFPIRKVVNRLGDWIWSWDRTLCVHHHESWFNFAPKQSNHDLAWIIGPQTAGPNPDRVGAIAGQPIRVPGVGGAPNTVNPLHFWQFTVGRATSNFDTTTFNTEFFFSQGPTGW